MFLETDTSWSSIFFIWRSKAGIGGKRHCQVPDKLQLSCGPPSSSTLVFFTSADLERARAFGPELLRVPASASLLTSCVTLNKLFYLLSLAVLLSAFVGLLWGLSEVTRKGTSFPGTGWAANNCQVPRETPALTVVTTVTSLETKAALSTTASSAPGWPVCFCSPSFAQLPPVLTAVVFPSPHPQISHKATL